jgi:hypothetical protein
MSSLLGPRILSVSSSGTTGIKYNLSSLLLLVSLGFSSDNISTAFLEAPVRYPLSDPLNDWPVAGLHLSREGLGIEQGGAPPDGILGLPLPQSSNPLSSLDPTGLQGEVDQLTWQFCLDLVSLPIPALGKSALSQVPSHWAEGEFDQLPGTSKRSSTGQGLPQKGGRKTVITFV